MKAVITVVGMDRTGIVAQVATRIAGHSINILEITQDILNDYFVMILIVDISQMNAPFGKVAEDFSKWGEKNGLSVRIQHEDLFRSMHGLERQNG